MTTTLEPVIREFLQGLDDPTQDITQDTSVLASLLGCILDLSGSFSLNYSVRYAMGYNVNAHTLCGKGYATAIPKSKESIEKNATCMVNS